MKRSVSKILRNFIVLAIKRSISKIFLAAKSTWIDLLLAGDQSALENEFWKICQQETLSNLVEENAKLLCRPYQLDHFSRLGRIITDDLEKIFLTNFL